MIGILRYVYRSNHLVAHAAIGAVIALSWAYLFYMERSMYGPAADCPMHSLPVWTLDYFLMTFLMWTVMMVAMMLPSAIPMVLMMATIAKARTRSTALPWVFLMGYLVVWTGFSITATALQGTLHLAALITADSLIVTPVLGGVLLISAGLYQWTPQKRACLVRCTPLTFLASEWREGYGGTFVMGLRHGAFCTGCCAGLMLLLFVAGVMNLLWIGVLAVTVLIEKLVGQRAHFTELLGALLIAAGIGLAFEGLWRS